MADKKNKKISRRLPDHVTDELVSILSEPGVYSFHGLFKKVYSNLKERKAVSGGEEMLRLRAYEKLQLLVNKGLARKVGRNYSGSKLSQMEEPEVQESFQQTSTDDDSFKDSLSLA